MEGRLVLRLACFPHVIHDRLESSKIVLLGELFVVPNELIPVILLPVYVLIET